MKAIGIILAGGNNSRMRELSDKRAIAAMPVAGSYRSIDFALSNMANSHVQKVAALISCTLIIPKGIPWSVGGGGTHAVIAAHTGIATRMFFTDLDQMKTGDLFFLNVLGEKLAYQVDQIVTVTPDRTDLLRIEEGKDQVTLVTCTPYGINSHRLLVRGKRIPYREAQKRAEQAKESGFLIWGKRVFVLSILFLGAAGFWLLKPSKRKEEKG